jgi:hypothetical protein
VALSKNSFATAPIAGGRTDPDFPNWDFTAYPTERN